MQDRLLTYTIHKLFRTHNRYNARNNESDHLKVPSCSVFQPMLRTKVSGEHKNKAFNLILHVRFHFEWKKLLTPFVGTTHFYWHSATFYHLHLRGSTIARFSRENRLIDRTFISKKLNFFTEVSPLASAIFDSSFVAITERRGGIPNFSVQLSSPRILPTFYRSITL